MSNLIDQLKSELASTHAAEQAWRFLRLFVVSGAVQVAAIGPDQLGRDALISAGVGAAEAAYRQWIPAVPWRVVAAKLHLIQASAPAAPAAPQPGSGQ